jgi:REP element-mobilizing transposase RayT
MARPLRIEFEGAWYHVMNRGTGRRQIFANDDQRQYFLSLLAETSERFNAEWHAYCLMGNHYHLLIRTPEGNLQRIMRHVNGVYTQYYNRSERRDGTLFRGRYKAILVDAESYWKQLSRYVHRNPLEARMVKRLERYPWSSYPAYIGVAARPGWLTCDYILKSIARRNAKARYRAYVEEGIDAELRAFYAGDRRDPILGDDEFKRRLQLTGKAVDIPDLRQARLRPTAEQIVDAVARRLQVPTETIWVPTRGRQAANPARAMAMYLCQREGDLRLSDIAARFGLRHYASASASIRQFQQRLAQDRKLWKSLNTIKYEGRPHNHNITSQTP